MPNQNELEAHAETEETGYAPTEGSSPEGPPQVLPDPAIQPTRPGEPPQVDPEPPDPGEPWTQPEPPKPPQEPLEPGVAEPRDI